LYAAQWEKGFSIPTPPALLPSLHTIQNIIPKAKIQTEINANPKTQNPVHRYHNAVLPGFAFTPLINSKKAGLSLKLNNEVMGPSLPN